MNKYYNVCRALITYNKPSTHQTINADVASYIRDSYRSRYWPNYVRALQGYIKISYGKELPTDDYAPCKVDYIY